MMLTIGIGVLRTLSPHDANSGIPRDAAAARAVATEIAKMAFAPRRPPSGVPSAALSAMSTPAWSTTSRPSTASRSPPSAFATARCTPKPP